MSTRQQTVGGANSFGPLSNCLRSRRSEVRALPVAFLSCLCSVLVAKLGTLFQSVSQVGEFSAVRQLLDPSFGPPDITAHVVFVIHHNICSSIGLVSLVEKLVRP